MSKKLLAALLAAAVICTALFAFAGCGLFKWKFTFTEYSANNKWDDGTEGYTVGIENKYHSKIKKIENIPTEHNGKPVVEVNFGNTDVTDLVIPDGIKYVRLYSCESLKNVTLPKTLRSIWEGNFSGCISLESLTVPDSCVGIGDGAFRGCTNLREIKLPASLTDISIKAFEGDGFNVGAAAVYDDGSNWVNGSFYLSNHLIWAGEAADENFTVKAGTTTICNDAFEPYMGSGLLKNTETVDLPDSIKYIGEDAFMSAGNLKEVYFGGSVTDWCAINFKNEYSNPVYGYSHNFYSSFGQEGNETKLFYVEDRKDVLAEHVQIPFRATTINDYAFAGFSCLKSVSCVKNPVNHVKYIGKGAFDGCINLKSLDFGSEIEEIGENAFKGCKSVDFVSVYGERYKAFEYLTDDKETWAWYNCIIDVKENKVLLFTSREIFIPDFAESIDDDSQYENASVIRYGGTREQWDAIEKPYNFNYYFRGVMIYGYDPSAPQTD